MSKKRYQKVVATAYVSKNKSYLIIDRQNEKIKCKAR